MATILGLRSDPITGRSADDAQQRRDARLWMKALDTGENTHIGRFSTMLAKIRNLSVRTKILGLTALTLVGLAVFAIAALNTLNLVMVNGPLYKGIINDKDLIADVLPPPEYLVEAYLDVHMMAAEQDKAKLAALVKRGAKLAEEYETRRQYWEKTLPPGQLRDAVVVDSYAAAKQFFDLRDKEFIPAALRGDTKRMNELADGKLKQIYEDQRAVVDRIVVLATQKAEADEKEVRSTIDSRMKSQLAPPLLVVFVSLLAAYFLSRYIANTLNEYLSFAGQVAHGDLSVRLHPKNDDELGALGKHLNGMVQSLREMAEQIRTNSQQIASSASEILATVSQFAASTAQTSSAVGETTATIEELKQAARLATEKAEVLTTSSQTSADISNSGTKATEDTISKINLIKQQMESIGETVVRLSEHSQAIEEIIATVQDIADQSNLLAVNASIEAARAGDHGKGFAVVAHEIKTLADQSRQATEQVRTILQDTRKWVSAVVMATERGAKAVDAGVHQSMAAGQAIQSLSGNVAGSVQVAGVIQATSEQQFVGIDQVAGAMSSIAEAARQNSDGAAHLEVAARKLSGLAEQLKESVDSYKL